ncbi:MAG: phage baseplate assembly protein V [Caldilineaceae bacterium]
MIEQAMAHKPYWGKYRGKVTSNTDDLGLGRIKVKVPSVTGEKLELQALPCTPYAGPQVGFFMIPPVGANVWIEFEEGDPNKPIWTGCFWGDGRRETTKPPTDAKAPDVKVLQTEKLVLMLDDQNGRLTAKLKEKADKGAGETMSLVMDKNGIVLTSKQVTITVTPDRIELKQGADVVELKDKITLKKAPATIEIADSITIKNSATTSEWSQSAINLKNGAASVAMSPSGVNINNGALEII